MKYWIWSFKELNNLIEELNEGFYDTTSRNRAEIGDLVLFRSVSGQTVAMVQILTGLMRTEYEKWKWYRKVKNVYEFPENKQKKADEILKDLVSKSEFYNRGAQQSLWINKIPLEEEIVDQLFSELGLIKPVFESIRAHEPQGEFEEIEKKGPEKGYIYIKFIPDNGFFKIGRAIDPRKRTKQLQTSHVRPLKDVMIQKVEDPAMYERAIRKYLKPFHVDQAVGRELYDFKSADQALTLVRSLTNLLDNGVEL